VRLTPVDLSHALTVIKQPEFWCRAKLFHALLSAQKKGVLEEVLSEMELPQPSIDLITSHLAAHWDPIRAGERVRSYDFEGRTDCYMEGVVMGEKIVEGCRRYIIAADTRVWENGEAERLKEYVYPPVNGTPTTMGGICNRVKRIQGGV
jgi:hypothetical protein